MRILAHFRVYESWLSPMAILAAVAPYTAFGDTPTEPAAEFLLSNALLSNLEIVSRNTTPFVDRGNTVQPNMTMTARVRVGDANGSALTYLDVGMHGTSVTTGTQAVGRRGNRHITVTASTNVDVDYAQEVQLTPQGMKEGTLYGSPRIRLTGVGTSNDFRLLNRVVARATLKRAPGMIQAALPGEEQRMNERLASSMHQGMTSAGGTLDTVLAKLQSQLTAPEAFRFQAAFSSRSGPNGGVTMRWNDPQGRARSPRPAAALSPQAAAQAVVSESFLVDSIAPQIAGKQLRMSELRNVLCVPNEKPLLDFCSSFPKDGPDLSILFDAEDPIGVTFADGGIRLKLNAVYKTMRRSEFVNNANNRLLRQPSNEDVTFETQPYSIDISYNLERDGATLKGVSVRDRAPAPTRSGTTPPGGTHDGAPVAKKTDISTALLSSVVKRQIESSVKKAVRERIEFGRVAVPTKIEAVGLGSTPTPQLRVLEAGGLMPLAARAENGWLVMSQYFCKEGASPLGVSWSEAPGALVLSSVVVGSPAATSGMQPGDRIESYGVPGERLVTPGSQEGGLPKFAGDRARGTTADQRTIEIAGRDASGRPFRRTVTMCPKDANYRAEAEALLAGRR